MIGLGDDRSMRLYKAIISLDSAKPGKRVTVMAHSLDEAEEKLEAEYGKGTVFDLHNEEDANRPR
jgi:hypothetical protein